jgi:hypothetical protein
MMFNGDAVCRAALYPKFVTPAGIFDEEALLIFAEIPDGGVYAMSVASKFLCRNDDGVHTYGSNAADIANERLRARLNRPPQPINEQVHYVGFYEFLYGDFKCIAMNHYSVHCDWLPEHGQDVHFQAEFRPKTTAAESTKKQRREDRRAAIGVLAARLRGPARHICEKDEPHREALESIDLPPMPRPT